MKTRRVGARVRLRAHNRDLGLGTHLWDGEILLDTGKKVRDNQCVVELAEPSAAPIIAVQVQKDVRVFEDAHPIAATGNWLKRGEKIEILELAVKPWNHGDYVTGRFLFNGTYYRLIMSELELPREHPYLSVVA